MASTKGFLLWPPVPERDLDWCELLPRAARQATETATLARRSLSVACKAVVSGSAAAACGNAELAKSAERYLCAVSELHAACANDPAWTGLAARPCLFKWRVAMFGGLDDVPEHGPGEQSVSYGDHSLLLERACAALALAAALQRASFDAEPGDAQIDALNRAAGALSSLRGTVLPLLRCSPTEGRLPHVFSPDFVAALQCAVSGQMLVCKARPFLRLDPARAAGTLHRALAFFDRAVAVLPRVQALQTARARSKAFAFGTLSDAALSLAGEAGLAEACMREAAKAVAGLERCEDLHALFTKRLQSVAQQNRVVFGCMQVPDFALEEVSVSLGQVATLVVSRDERGKVVVTLPEQ